MKLIPIITFCLSLFFTWQVHALAPACAGAHLVKTKDSSFLGFTEYAFNLLYKQRTPKILKKFDQLEYKDTLVKIVNDEPVVIDKPEHMVAMFDSQMNSLNNSFYDLPPALQKKIVKNILSFMKTKKPSERQLEEFTNNLADLYARGSQANLVNLRKIFSFKVNESTKAQLVAQYLEYFSIRAVIQETLAPMVPSPAQARLNYLWPQFIRENQVYRSMINSYAFQIALNAVTLSALLPYMPRVKVQDVKEVRDITAEALKSEDPQQYLTQHSEMNKYISADLRYRFSRSLVNTAYWLTLFSALMY